MGNTHVYCEVCDGIQLIRKHDMGGNDVSGDFTNPTDMICSNCDFIVCTTYSLKCSQEDKKDDTSS